MKVTETAAPGLQEAFWLWPDDRYPSATVWPAAGEIDIAETYSRYPDLAIPYLHYTAWDNWGPQPGVNTAWDCLAPRGEWHTYTLSWTDTRLRIEVDGQHCLTNDSDDPAFDKPYIVALTQALGVEAQRLGRQRADAGDDRGRLRQGVALTRSTSLRSLSTRAPSSCSIT